MDVSNIYTVVLTCRVGRHATSGMSVKIHALLTFCCCSYCYWRSCCWGTCCCLCLGFSCYLWCCRRNSCCDILSANDVPKSPLLLYWCCWCLCRCWWPSVAGRQLWLMSPLLLTSLLFLSSQTLLASLWVLASCCCCRPYCSVHAIAELAFHLAFTLFCVRTIPGIPAVSIFSWQTCCCWCLTQGKWHMQEPIRGPP